MRCAAVAAGRLMQLGGHAHSRVQHRQARLMQLGGHAHSRVHRRAALVPAGRDRRPSLYATRLGLAFAGPGT